MNRFLYGTLAVAFLVGVGFVQPADAKPKDLVQALQVQCNKAWAANRRANHGTPPMTREDFMNACMSGTPVPTPAHRR